MASVVLDQPERRNPHSPYLWERLALVPGQLSQLTPDIRVVVVRAEGPSFSAGLDRRMFTPEGIPGQPSLLDLSRASADEFDSMVAGFQSAFSWLRDPARLTVAAVQGHAVGAGFQLALACDLRIVADDVSLSMKETALGLVPDLGGTAPLVECIGYARALELCVTGRAMGAAEAVASGLALRSVPADDLAAATDSLVESLLVAPLGAVQATKALLLSASRNDYPTQLAAERAAQAGRIAALAQQLG